MCTYVGIYFFWMEHNLKLCNSSLCVQSSIMILPDSSKLTTIVHFSEFYSTVGSSSFRQMWYVLFIYSDCSYILLSSEIFNRLCYLKLTWGKESFNFKTVYLACITESNKADGYTFMVILMLISLPLPLYSIKKVKAETKCGFCFVCFLLLNSCHRDSACSLQL